MHRRMFSRLTALVLPCLLLAACGASANPNQVASQLSFGVDMARRGLWSEALFRFQQAERMEPQSPRVLNNLAVAYEATGDFDKALDYYKRALQISPDNREARANYSRFVEFYQGFRAQGQRAQGAAPAAGAEGAAAAPAAAPEPVPEGGSRPALPLTPPGQTPPEQVPPPEGDTATPPPNDPASPPPPASR
jgi:tetratricopeptide (TPR) repeat protein